MGSVTRKLTTQLTLVSNDDDLSPEMEAMVQETSKRLDRRKKRPKTVGAAVFHRTTEETKEMMKSREWDSATPRHLVALYTLMHEKVYGIECTDLDSKSRYNITMMATNFTERQFGGDVVKVIDYFRWVWGREVGREKWRRAKKVDGSRIGPYHMFSGKMLPEYRLSLARTQGRG